jgi:hypothetical protein
MLGRIKVKTACYINLINILFIVIKMEVSDVYPKLHITIFDKNEKNINKQKIFSKVSKIRKKKSRKFRKSANKNLGSFENQY